MATVVKQATSSPTILWEPLPPLTGGKADAIAATPYSPDPHHSFGFASTWSRQPSALGRETVTQALDVHAWPPEAFQGLQSLLRPPTDVLVRAPGWIRLDFGVERAGWVELETTGISGTPSEAQLHGAVGESDAPAPMFSSAFKPYGTPQPPCFHSRPLSASTTAVCFHNRLLAALRC